MLTDVLSLSGRWQVLLSVLEEQEGVLTPEQSVLLEKLGEDKDKIVERLAGIHTYYLKQSSACEEESVNQLVRKKSFDKKASSIKLFLYTVIKIFGGKILPKSGNTQYKTPLVTVNESTSKSVNVFKPEVVPEKFKTYTVEIRGLTAMGRDLVIEQLERIGQDPSSINIEQRINIANLAELLKAGETVLGAELVVSKSITIK